MIAYIDSSVLLRLALGQKPALKEWKQVTHGVTSALAEVECLRTLDRLRHAGHLDERAVAARHDAVYRIMEALEVVEVTPAILRRAAQPLASPLGTLDSIHLATATLWRDERDQTLVIATHDEALAAAARTSGLRAIGDNPA